MTSQERLRKADYVVRPVPQLTGRRLIRLHHYSRGAPAAAVFVHGLLRREDPLRCLGVAWWMPPALYAAQGAWAGDWRCVLVLSRLAIAPEVPVNGASFLIAGSVRLIQADGRYRCLISYADTAMGHTGAIYRAANWEDLGLVAGHAMWRDEGRDLLISDKTWSGSRSPSALREAGYVRQAPAMRHKFRLVLKQARPPRTLFDALLASPGATDPQQPSAGRRPTQPGAQDSGQGGAGLSGPLLSGSVPNAERRTPNAPAGAQVAP